MKRTFAPTSIFAICMVSCVQCEMLHAQSAFMIRLGYPSAPDDLLNQGSGAADISADGTTVSGSVRVRPGPFGTEPFRWTPEDGMVGLPDLTGGVVGGIAWAVSDNGKWIVGEGTSSRGVEATLWGPDGQIHSLGLLSDALYSRAFDVSADGSMVIGEAGSSNSPFIWTPKTGMRSAYEVLAENGLDLVHDGWFNVGLTGLSDDGRWICGTGRNPDGLYEAFIIHMPVPAPGTLGVLALGALVVSRRRR